MNEQLPTPIDEVAPALTPEPAPPVALPVTAFDKLAGALSACTKEIGDHPVIKRGKNQFHGYKYPRIEDVMEVVSDAMAKFGLVLQQGETGKGFLDKGSVVFVQYEFYFMHESGQCSPRVVNVTGQSRTRDSKAGYDDKSIIKCHTQARKAFLMSTFQIKTADEGSERPRKDKDRPDIQQPKNEMQDALKAGAIIKPEQPVAIPRGDGQWQDWTRAWLMMVNGAPDIATCEAWLAANGDTLNQLEDELLTHYQFIMREYNKRIRKLAPSEKP
jgi:hypothetical protein